MSVQMPARKPARPFFSSGPCAKPPGYAPSKLATESLGRSHRAKIGKSRLQLAIDLMREVLQVPDTHRIGIVPGSDTGAFEMAMWTMLGARGVTTLAWESFGEGWVTDAVKQLKLDPTVIRADYGALPDLTQVNFADDVLFTWNGTTSGVRVPDGEWIPDDREGLTFADATSAVFAYDIDWSKIDVATFSWQKVLGDVYRHVTWFLYAEDQGRIVGVLPLAQVKSLLFGHSLVGLPFTVYGGVAAASDAAAKALEQFGAPAPVTPGPAAPR